MRTFFHKIELLAKVFTKPFVILVLLILIINNSNATTEKELQEVRYAKALIAYNDKNYNKALKYLDQNLNFTYVHLESIELLAKIHEQNKDYKKAIRVYYFLLKKSKALDYIRLNFDENFKDKLSDLPPPDIQQLNYFFKLGSIYLSYYDYMQEIFEKDDNIQSLRDKQKGRDILIEINKSFNKKFKLATQDDKREAYNYKIISLAKKYLTICKINSFSLGLTNFMLGLAEKKKGNYHESSKLFKLAYQISFDTEFEEGKIEEKSLDDGQKSLKEVLEFYIGDSLFKEGHRELATRYLKSLSGSTKTGALKSFTKLYIDSLESSYLSFNLAFGSGVDSLPVNLDPSTFSNPDYGESDFFTSAEFNVFYNSNQKNNWAYTLNASFDQFTYFNNIFEPYDARTYTAGGEIKLLKMPTSIWKLSTNITNVHSKQDDAKAFSSFSQSLEVTPQYDRYMSFGIVSLSAPTTILSYVTTNGTVNATERLYSLSVTPWGSSRMFQPTYSASFGSTTTNGIVSPSTNYRFSFSNQFSISDLSNAFLSFSARIDDAQTQSQSVSEYALQTQWVYSLEKYLKDLILITKLISTYTKTGVDTPAIIKKHRLSVSAQFTF